jgi:ATP-dependent DNA ligase
MSFSFIEPMKALPVEQLPEGDWLYEIKHDGYRALAFKKGKEVRLISRNNKPLNYPTLVDSLKKLPAEQVVLHGEIAALDEKGRSSFQLLQLFKSSGDVPLVYYVFDLLFLDGKDLRGQPLSAMRKLLTQLLKKPSGSRTSFGAPEMNCCGSLKSLVSRDWSPKNQIQSTKVADVAAPGSSTRSPRPRSS